MDLMKRMVHCAKLLAWDRRNSPAWTGPHDNTQLGYAAALRMADVLQPWIKDTRTTAAVLETPFHFVPFDQDDDETVEHDFSLCEVVSPNRCPFDRGATQVTLTADEMRYLGLHEAAPCISILASHPACSPAFKTDDDSDRTVVSNMVVACELGALDVVTRWLKDPRCTSEALHGDGQHVDAWGVACNLACTEQGERRDAALRLLELLVEHPLIDPSHTTELTEGNEYDATYLALACVAGTPNIVKRMLADPRCPDFNLAMNRPLMVAYDAVKLATDWTARAAIRECARLVASHVNCEPLQIHGVPAMADLSTFWYACALGCMTWWPSGSAATATSSLSSTC